MQRICRAKLADSRNRPAGDGCRDTAEQPRAHMKVCCVRRPFGPRDSFPLVFILCFAWIVLGVRPDGCFARRFLRFSVLGGLFV